MKASCAACALGVGLGACTSSRTFVLSPAAPIPSDGAIAIRRADATVPVEPGVVEKFEGRLSERLAADAQLRRDENADLALEYRIVLNDTGHAGVRVASGVASLLGSPFYGLGDGAFGVEVSYRDRAGREIAKILVDGPIAGAFGSTWGGLDSAAESIAVFTRQEFPVRVQAQADREQNDAEDSRGPLAQR